MGTFRHTYFSVGERCATAHQIRRVTRVEDAFLFDWLITRDDSFRQLASPDENLLVSGNWTVVDEGLRLLDHGTRWLFQHEFETDSFGKVDPSRVEAHLPVARQKFLHLKHKTLSALRECRSGVVIREEKNLAAEEAPSRLDQLREVFSAINPGLKLVIASPHIRQEVFGADHLMLHLDMPPPGPNFWMGDDASFSRLFEISESQLA
ncbi:MAG: hypothetical protein ABIR26_03365 [Ramlibacter sp.]